MVPGVWERPVNVVYYADIPDVGYSPGDVVSRSSNGLHRQSDMSGGNRLVTNGDPLCDTCHKLND
ncbi:MAG: hypothetical protein P1P84_13520 [Deferrisomatales bacterium]|nr:hypothetical protein [Deferrisomatales bacterium]